MKTLGLRNDIYALIGTRDGRGRHIVYEIEKKEDLECLCGRRGDWLIVFEEPDKKLLDEELVPMMVAEAIRDDKTGESPSTSPVIYYCPPMKRLYTN